MGKKTYFHLLPSKTDLTGAALDIGVPFSTPFGCAHRRFSQKAVRMVHTNPAPKMTSADQCWNKMANQAIMKWIQHQKWQVLNQCWETKPSWNESSIKNDKFWTSAGTKWLTKPSSPHHRFPPRRRLGFGGGEEKVGTWAVHKKSALGTCAMFTLVRESSFHSLTSFQNWFDRSCFGHRRPFFHSIWLRSSEVFSKSCTYGTHESSTKNDQCWPVLEQNG